MNAFRYRGFALFLVVAAATLATTVAANAQEPAQTRGYDAFKGMRTRNIFDPDRRGPRIESAQSASSTNQPGFMALTGTMVTSGKTLAFFAGSRSDFNKVLAVREKIADYTVTNITSTHVELEHEGKPVTLAVGKQITMDGSGTITASTGGASTASSSSRSTSGSDMTPPAGVPADKAEILRRMMERRQQEISK